MIISGKLMPRIRPADSMNVAASIAKTSGIPLKVRIAPAAKKPVISLTRSTAAVTELAACKRCVGSKSGITALRAGLNATVAQDTRNAMISKIARFSLIPATRQLSI